MKKSERIEPIKQIAADHEQNAVQDLGQSRRALSEHEMKLEQLIQYRAEYARLFQEHGSRGMDGSQLQAYQGFLSQLDVAIRAQRGMIQQVKLECEDKRHEWQQRHTRTEALSKTIDRFRAAENKQKDKQEQKEADDHTNAHFWKQNH